MAYNEFEWRRSDGACMFACEWRMTEPERVQAVIGIVHGMGEHSGRYKHVAEMLMFEGCAVMTFDQCGHGRTAGKRGDAPSYDALLESVDLLLIEARRNYPDKPIFLYGHSMGGNVTLNYILRRKPEIRGAIVTGPWLKLAFEPPLLQIALGRVMEQLYPQYLSTRPMIAEQLTSDPEMIQRYLEDKLIHGKISARFFFTMQRAGLWALKHAEEMSIPLLLMHASDDKVTSTKASRQFSEAAGPLCTIVEWPEYRHELHNDVGRAEVFNVMRQWLRTSLAE